MIGKSRKIIKRPKKGYERVSFKKEKKIVSKLLCNYEYSHLHMQTFSMSVTTVIICDYNCVHQ